jgi:outer membrane protease
MKNITVFAVLVIMFFPAYSQEQPDDQGFSFSISPQFGFVWGQALELVYSVPANTKNDLLSELIWDMKPVFYLGFQVDFGRTNIMSAPGFFASFNYKTGISVNSGRMEDRDWLWPENNNLTRFTRHSNNTNEFFNMSIALGASIPLRYLYIKPFVNGTWMSFKFSGRNGYGYYLDYLELSPPKDPQVWFSDYGTVITYKQDWYLLAAGLSLGTKILHPFSFELSFQISPFSYCIAVDNHLYEQDNTYEDFTFGKLYLEPALTLSYRVEKVDISLACSYRHIARTKGNSYENKVGPVENKAGAGLTLWDTHLLVKINLY